MKVIINLGEVDNRQNIKLKKVPQKVWGYLGKSNWHLDVWVIDDREWLVELIKNNKYFMN